MTRQTRRLARLAAAALAVCFALAGALPAAAAPARGAAKAAAPDLSTFTIMPTPRPGSTRSPGNISMLVTAGDSYTASVSVINYASTTTRFWLYAADAYTITNGGGFAVEGIGMQPHGVGAWVSPLPHTVAIPGRHELIVGFTIRVPRDAQPGMHAGGIVVEDTTPQVLRASSQLQVKRYLQVFTRVYLTVGGLLRPGFTVSGLSVDHPQPPIPLVTRRDGHVSYMVTNTGNALLAPVVHLRVSGMFGAAADETFPATSQILPGSRANFELPWRDVPALGPVHVYLTVRSALGISRTVSYSYLALPVPFLATVGAVLVIAVLAVIRVARRRRRSAGRQTDSAPAPVAAG
jgi:hypothetical protein